MSHPESTRRRATSASVAVLLALGLARSAGAQVTVSTDRVLRLQVGERDVQLVLSREEIQGPGIALRRTGSSLVGRLHGAPVDIGWSGGSVLGRVGDAPVRLSVTPRTPAPGVAMEGTFAGWATSLAVAPLGISGSAGGCDYSLPQAGSHYDGWRTCGTAPVRSEPVPVTLALPRGAVALGNTEEAALLALLLSDAALPPGP